MSFGALYALGVAAFPAMVLLAIFPGMILLNEISNLNGGQWYLLCAPMVALSFVVLLCLEIAAVKWLLLGKVKAGRYPLHGSFYCRKWFVVQLLDLSLDVLGPLYASIYLAPWYRMLGARLGVRAEISTASFISPDLLELGDESFVTDSASLGAARIERGEMTIGVNRIGKRSCIGNSAMLPPGTMLGDSCLIGCLSAPPEDPREAARVDTTWLGSPGFLLPQRQKSSGAFDEAQTFKPTASLRAQRAAIEFVRVILPSTSFIVIN